MCGIFGFVGTRSSVEEGRRLLTRSVNLLGHRGPDALGVWAGEGVGLAARRLAVVDLEGGAQPFVHAATGVVGAFNGEVYNHRALREALQAEGHRFVTRCDTEVLVVGYLAWGEDIFARAEGMLACALWDARDRVLVLARDRFGEKPLFVAHHDGGLAFASEMKSLLRLPGFVRRLNPEASAHFLKFEHLFDPLTPFEGIAALPPAHVMRVRFDDARAATPRRYWQLAFRPREGDATPTDDAPPPAVVEALGALVRDAVKTRCEADVRVGTLLSGGLDSSLVTATAAGLTEAPLDSFSVGFGDARYDESDAQDRVAEAFGLRLNRFDFHAHTRALLESMPGSLWASEYPDPGFEQDVVFQHLAGLAASRGYKVLLGGEGADELFRGYDHYVRLPAFARYAQSRNPDDLPTVPGFDPGAIARFADDEHVALQRWGVPCSLLRPEFPWHFFLQAGRHADVVDTFFLPPYREGAPRLPPMPEARGLVGNDLLQWHELHTRLPAYILRTLDRYSMASGVEVRCPFMDHRLWEFFADLPPALRDAGPGHKPLLRALAGALPPEVAARPKQGFRAPYLLTTALRQPEMEPALRDLLRPAAIEALGVVRADFVDAHLDAFRFAPETEVDRVRRVMFSRLLALRMLATVFVDEFDLYADAHDAAWRAPVVG